MIHEAYCTFPEELLEKIVQQGLDVLPELIRRGNERLNSSIIFTSQSDLRN